MLCSLVFVSLISTIKTEKSSNQLKDQKRFVFALVIYSSFI